MIDFTRIVGFDWDDGNGRKSWHKHAVSQREAEEIFLDRRVLIADDIVHSTTERRLQALGETRAGRGLHVAFTLRYDQTLIRIISARDMNRKEGVRYEA
jgi:uncharacterized DUF497 family protein